jgi:hypothetical protein
MEAILLLPDRQLRKIRAVQEQTRSKHTAVVVVLVPHCPIGVKMADQVAAV